MRRRDPNLSAEHSLPDALFGDPQLVNWIAIFFYQTTIKRGIKPGVFDMWFSSIKPSNLSIYRILAVAPLFLLTVWFTTAPDTGCGLEMRGDEAAMESMEIIMDCAACIAWRLPWSLCFFLLLFFRGSASNLRPKSPKSPTSYNSEDIWKCMKEREHTWKYMNIRNVFWWATTHLQSMAIQDHFQASSQICLKTITIDH